MLQTQSVLEPNPQEDRTCGRGASTAATSTIGIAAPILLLLAYAISNAIFGGSTEAVALWLKAKGGESHFFWYVSIMGVVVFLTSLTLHKGEGTLVQD